MINPLIFNFTSDISKVNIPSKLNNPFKINISEIAKIAVKEFKFFISLESKKWNYDFRVERGKMFGVLVIKKPNNTYCYLGAVSGKLPENKICDKLIPSVFDEASGDFFFNTGMLRLSEFGNKIKHSNSTSEIIFLKEERREKSVSLQKRMFENYHFENLSGRQKNILEIYRDSVQGSPPSATGECAAPKLLQYAIKNQLEPISLAEFWWGSSVKNKEKKHGSLYPACRNRCRPILEYILEDKELFTKSNI